ncbi:tyrosyl-tRNA synthetase, partial [Serendipita sp. 399]
GVELVRKANFTSENPLDSSLTNDEGATDEGVEDVVFGMTIPLLTTSSGEKFGKSAGNAVWLDQCLTSVFDFYQFFIRVSDADLPLYLNCLTLLSMEDIDILMREHLLAPEKRLAQHKLAAEVTQMIHGEPALKQAQFTSAVLYDTSSSLENTLTSSSDSIPNLLEALRGNPRLKQVSRDQVIGEYIAKVASSLGLLASQGKAKNLLRSGGLYLNNHRVTELDRKLDSTDFIGDKVAFIRAGKEILVIELLPNGPTGGVQSPF